MNTPLTDEEIAELRKLHEAGTSIPWTAGPTEAFPQRHFVGYVFYVNGPAGEWPLIGADRDEEAVLSCEDALIGAK